MAWDAVEILQIGVNKYIHYCGTVAFMLLPNLLGNYFLHCRAIQITNKVIPHYLDVWNPNIKAFWLLIK